MPDTGLSGDGTSSHPAGGRVPAVSVVIPTYNSLELLRVALEHLARQTLDADELEVLVVDDGSTDGTWEYLVGHAAGWPQLQIFHQPNSGTPSVGRNKALRVATGRYVFFHDADDYLGEEALQRMVSTADAYSCDVVVGRTVHIGGQAGGEDPHRSGARRSPSRTAIDADLVMDKVWSNLAPQKLFRRSLITDTQLEFPEDMVQGEDQVFVASCLFTARRVTVLGDYDYYHRHSSPAGTNLSSRTQSLKNKELTTTRVASLIVAHTEPGPRRDAMFERVLLSTLPSGLHHPFLNASADEQSTFLRRIQAEVLPYLTDRHLKKANDRKRLRLAVARAGTVADLLELNRRLAAPLAYTVADGVLSYDLGSRLNWILPSALRHVTSSFSLSPTLTALDPKGGSVELELELHPPARAPWDSIHVLAQQRQAPTTVELLAAPYPARRLRLDLEPTALAEGGRRVRGTRQSTGVMSSWNVIVEGQLGGVTVSTARLRWPEDVGTPAAPETARGASCRSGRNELVVYRTRHGNVALRWQRQPAPTELALARIRRVVARPRAFEMARRIRALRHRRAR